MTVDEKRDALLRELLDEGELDEELLGRIAGALGPQAAPTADARRRLFETVSRGGRLHRFADRVAELLDVDVARARTLLDGIDDKDSWEASPLPNVRLYHVAGGSRVAGAITGFVRIPEGGVFPEHDHSGDETVLIVQGRCRDSHDGSILVPGDLARMTPSDGAHEVLALPGPALVYLAVVFEGIAIGGQHFGPDVL